MIAEASIRSFTRAPAPVPAPLPSPVTLYFREGSSDKVYCAHIEPAGAGFVVNFAYGRRGAHMTAGTKTPAPIPLDQAAKIFGKLVTEKTAKGYAPAPGAQSPAPAPHFQSPAPRAVTPRAAETISKSPAPQLTKAELTEAKPARILPQLLNPIDADDDDAPNTTPDTVAKLLADPAWCLQPKHDGKRIILRRSGPTVEGINRTGSACAIAPEIACAALHLPAAEFLIDGEMVGGTFHAFDLLEIHGISRRRHPYADRLNALTALHKLGELRAAEQSQPDRLQPIRLSASFSTATDKAIAYQSLRAAKAEGVVFKRVDAPYTPGRPNSGGPQLKYKFIATASALVSSHTKGKRSIEMQMHDAAGNPVAVGKCTVPPNADMPAIGTVVEVRYLYAFEGSGYLFQPVYIGQRDDLDATACALSQLKLKPE